MALFGCIDSCRRRRAHRPRVKLPGRCSQGLVRYWFDLRSPTRHDATGRGGRKPVSGNGIARGSTASSAGGAARAMLASTTMSLGPPMISKCSTLSRRTRMIWRLLEMLARPTTASRGFCWRVLASLSRPLPNRRTVKAVTPSSPATMMNAKTNCAASGVSARNKSRTSVLLPRWSPRPGYDNAASATHRTVPPWEIESCKTRCLQTKKIVPKHWCALRKII